MTGQWNTSRWRRPTTLWTIGNGVSELITLYFQLPTLVSPFSIIVAVGVSTVIGVFFGFYPARKAAQLDPIDALRYE